MGFQVGSGNSKAGLALRAVRFVRYLPQFVRLYWRLWRDPRVSIWAKAFLFGGVIYLLSPIDLVPDFKPLLGHVDDLVLFIAACRMFIYLCPPEVVQEHVRRIDAGL